MLAGGIANGADLAALVVLLINALLTKHQSQQRLEQANQNLRQSAQDVEKLAMDHERSRVACNIHDSLDHFLTALNIQLACAESIGKIS